MKNKPITNLSLRKFLLAVLVAGPLAILPVPLWAIPQTTSTNLTASSGVTVQAPSSNTLNITAPDKAVLTWKYFGDPTLDATSGLASTIAATDTINYFLPSAAGSVLNVVNGGTASTINGTIASNGNVYLLNPSGITIGSTATVNVGGFYASTVNEPLAAAGFALNGTLSFSGPATTGVTVNGGNYTAVGTGNKIWLVGGNVAVNSGNFYGNLTVKSVGTTAAGVWTAGNATFAGAGAVNVNQLGAPATAGNLVVESNGGNAVLTGAGTIGTAGAITMSVPLTSSGSVTAVAAPGAGLGGAGYTPNSQIAVTVTAPTILQRASSTTSTSTTTIGTAASIVANTDASGVVTSFTVLNGGANYTAAPTITLPAPTGLTLNVAGTASVNTTGTNPTTGVAVAGNVSQADSNNLLTIAGTTTITAGTATAQGTITIDNSNLSTVAVPLAGKTSIVDGNGGLTVGNVNIIATAAGNNLKLDAGTGNSLSMASGAKIKVDASAAEPVPTISARGSTVTLTGSGALTFSALTTSTASGRTAAVTTDGNITVGSTSNPQLNLTSTAGTITAGNLTGTTGGATFVASGDVTVGATSGSTPPFNTSQAIKLTSQTGRVTVGVSSGAFTSAAVLGSGSEITAVGDVNMNTLSLAAASGVKITSSQGQVLLGSLAGNGTVTAATNLTIGAAGSTGNAVGSVSIDKVGTNATGAANSAATLPYGNVTGISVSNGGAGYYAANSQIAVTLANAPAGGTNATAYATTNANGQISGFVITNPGAGYTTAPSLTIPAPTQAVVAGGSLALTATGGTLSIGGSVVSNSTSSLDLKAAQNISLPAVTAPVLTVTSTGGNITQSGAIVSTSKATFDAATDITLTTTTNDLATLVLKNAPNGVTYVGSNDVILGGGTSTKGNVSITAGAGVTSLGASLVNVPVTVSSPNSQAYAVVTTNSTSGVVTGVTSVTGGSGYAFSAAPSAVAVTFAAPPANVTPGAMAAASTGPSNYGYIVTGGTLSGAVLPAPVGNGYLPNSTVPLTVTDAGATTVPAAIGIVNGNGQIASVQVTNVGAGVTAALNIAFPAPTTVATTATGYAITNSSGVVTGVFVTDPGAGYYGSYTPNVTIAAPTGTTNTTALGTTNAAGALTSIAVGATPGSNYSGTPTVTIGGGAKATVTLGAGATAGQIATITPYHSGGITLGGSATDSITVAGNLTLATAAPAGTRTSDLVKYSEINTVANNLYVGGNVTINTAGSNSTLGVANLGAASNYSFGAVGGNLGAGTLSVTENLTLNLGTLTAGTVNATSIGSNIVNSGALTVGTLNVFAKSIFSPGDVTLTNSNNNVTTLNVGIANDLSFYNSQNATVNAGIAGVPSKAVAGTANVSVASGKSITMGVTALSGGDYNIVSFNAPNGAVTITDPNSLTLQNAVNGGTGAVTVTAQNGTLSLGSGINLNSTGIATFRARDTAASIVDIAPNISIYGQAVFQSDNGISLTKAGHSMGPVTLQSGFNAVATGATANTDITYTEAGTANLNVVRVNQSGLGVNGSLTVASSSGNIQQTTATGVIVVPTSATSTNTVSFSAPNGAVTLTNPVGTVATGNNIAPAIALSAKNDSSVVQNLNSLVLGNVSVVSGAFTADTSAAAAGKLPYTISQATGSSIFAYGASTFKTNGAAVTLNNAGNNFGAVTISTNNGLAPVAAVAPAGPAAAAGVIGNVTTAVAAGSRGNSYPASSTGVAVTVADTAPGVGTGATAFGTTDAWGQLVSITVNNGGSGYTGPAVFTITTVPGNAALGADVGITEAGTLNLANVNTGTAGKLAATSSGGGIIETSAPGITVGGTASFTAQSAGITLNSGNTFSNTVTLATPGNVILQDGSLNTVFATGTGGVGGSLTVRNTNAAGTISDGGVGNLLVAGNVLFDAGTGNINITGANNSFGGLTFRGATVSIAENNTLNLAGVSVATGAVSLSSNAGIVTSGSGTSTFSFAGGTSVTLSAGGAITISNPFYAANGLTFRALGAVDLSAMSLLNNLNNKTPNNLGAASYKAPGP